MGKTKHFKLFFSSYFGDGVDFVIMTIFCVQYQTK